MAMTQGNTTPGPQDLATARARIDELEIKLSFQEQLIGELHDELVNHGAQLTRLHQQQQQLIEYIRGISGKDEDAPADERPPHY